MALRLAASACFFHRLLKLVMRLWRRFTGFGALTLAIAAVAMAAEVEAEAAIVPAIVAAIVAAIILAMGGGSLLSAVSLS